MDRLCTYTGLYWRAYAHLSHRQQRPLLLVAASLAGPQALRSAVPRDQAAAGHAGVLRADRAVLVGAARAGADRRRGAYLGFARDRRVPEREARRGRLACRPAGACACALGQRRDAFRIHDAAPDLADACDRQQSARAAAARGSRRCRTDPGDLGRLPDEVRRPRSVAVRRVLDRGCDVCTDRAAVQALRRDWSQRALAGVCAAVAAECGDGGMDWGGGDGTLGARQQFPTETTSDNPDHPSYNPTPCAGLPQSKPIAT